MKMSCKCKIEDIEREYSFISYLAMCPKCYSWIKPNIKLSCKDIIRKDRNENEYIKAT